MKPGVVAYCRVSTLNQKEEGTIQIQEKAIKAHTKEKGIHLLKVFRDDGVSGGLENRPGLAAMFDYLEGRKKGQVKAVVIFKLDRLARDLYIQEHLIRKLDDLGVELASMKEPDLAGGDPMRKAFRQFMGIVSELEKAFITMRLSGGRVNKAGRGGYAGGRPAFGYVPKARNLNIEAARADAVRDIFRLRGEGVSLQGIADHLNGQGIRASNGGPFSKSTVLYILNNSIYKGHYKYSGVEARNPDYKIISSGSSGKRAVNTNLLNESRTANA